MTTPSPRRRTLAWIGAVLLAAACGVPVVDEGGSGEGSGGSPNPTETQSLEGAFRYETMDDYVNAVLPMIREWHEGTWPDLPEPRRVTYVPNGASGPEGCQDREGNQASYSSESYEYCGGDQMIYVGQDLLWALYDRAGDAGPAVGLAHEWAHHIQSVVGVTAPQSAEASIQLENQADCIAGAWVLFTKDKGYLELPDDIEDIEQLFPLIASAESADRDHGTLQEREESFNLGYTKGLPACDRFFPDTPVS
ncbi:neutral zinc metallopeptidase [Luedemannella helvata]